MNIPIIGSVMISCEERTPFREQTLSSIAASDFSGNPLEVVFDHEVCGPSLTRKQSRQELVAHWALRKALSSAWDFILFLEDDVAVNRYLLHNLVSWPVLRAVNLASLYNPNVAGPGGQSPDSTAYVANPERVYGSQAFLMSRACAAHCLDRWYSVAGMQDIKLSRLSAELGPIFYHSPSLVQHTGTKSTWTSDNRFHTAPDYDPDWQRCLGDKSPDAACVPRPEHTTQKP